MGRRAVVVSVGEELLDGRIVDTNAPWAARELLQLGYRVVAMHTVGDGRGELELLLRGLSGEVDLVVSTGGLGPTADDRTREEGAALLGAGLQEVPDAMAPLAASWARHHDQPPPEFFLAQARVPVGSQPLENPAGTAWGFALRTGGLLWLALPGPPGECAATWVEGGGRALAAAEVGDGAGIALAVLHTCGLPESRIEALVRDRMEQTGAVRLGITARPEGVSLSVLATPDGETSAGARLQSELDVLCERLGEWCWGRDTQTLAEVVLCALRERGQTLAVAESCTGGLLGGELTEVAGSSEVFLGGWVTYTDASKVRDLGVPEPLLAAHGAVSREVARAMAEGARARAGADWAVAVTGIAGPDGGSAEKPVGTVCFGWASPQGSGAVLRRQFARAGRASVRRQSVRDALDLLRRALAALPPLPDADRGA